MEKDTNMYTINKDLTLLDALIQIENNHYRSLIVVDGDNKVLGSLSDGDVRRALINGILLSSHIYKTMNRDCIFVKEDSTDVDVKSFFDESDIFLLPCLNDERRLVKLYFKP